MIKFRPQWQPLSRSIKEEKIFDSMEDMKQYVFDCCQHFFSYVGNRSPFAIEDIEISEIIGNDDRTGWKNVRRIIVKDRGIGFCGE